jgi:uncharacterized protein YbjT (DUF2867 family)
MILVTGATTPVGRSIVDQLATSGRAVRVLTRDEDHDDLPSAAEIAVGNLTDPSSLSRAMVGVQSVFLLASVPDFICGFLNAADTAGVERIVFQSTGAIDDWAATQSNDVAAVHGDIERSIRASGIGWTFLRLEVASSDALQWAFDVPRQMSAGDVVRGPYAGAAGSPIHPADFAAVVIAALTDDEHDRRTYAVTGPVSLTHSEQVRLIGQVRGRTYYYDELDEPTARARINPYAPADLLFETWARHVGVPAPITDTVHRLTGRPPRTPRQWAMDYPRWTP